jgi:hypothetical protein
MRLALLAVTALLVLALAATAGAQTTVTPTVTPLTAPSPMPVEFPGNIYSFGAKVPAGAPIPAGATVLSLQIPVVAHQTAMFSVACPTGSLAVDPGVDPTTPVTFGFDGPLSLPTASLVVGDPTFSGTAVAYVVCLPASLTPGAGWSTSHVKRAPVSFPRVPIGRTTPATLRKNAKLPAGSQLMTEVLLPISGQSSVSPINCSGGRTPTLAATSVPGVKAVVGPAGLYVHAGTVKSGAQVRAYVLCVHRRAV